MILDIGYGNAPRGHVNMDLFMNATTPDLKNKEGQYAFIDPKKIPKVLGGGSLSEEIG